jgi:thymidylate synthase ThyX
MQDFAEDTYTELAKVIPSFIRRTNAEHPNQKSFEKFQANVQKSLEKEAKRLFSNTKPVPTHDKVRLVDSDQDAITKVLGALMFPYTELSLYQLEDHLRTLPKAEIESLLQALTEPRENRRHKAPRALERAFFTFEIETDFGAYRDLQRHRTLTQDRQRLTCNLGFDVPEELVAFGMEKPYIEVMEKAKTVFQKIATKYPEQAQYVVPMGYNIRWFFHVNLRALQWMCELRSSPAGHSSYRYIAQEMASQVMSQYPEFSHFFKYVDFDGYKLGRLGQEMRKEGKQTVGTGA